MPVHLLTGDDESILRAAVTDLVHTLVGDGERSLMVSEFDGEDVEVRSVVDAAQTPPFLSERRVVLLRDVGRFSSEDLAPLVAYLGDPLATTDLVLVGGGGRLARSLTDAVKAGGATKLDTTPPQRARDRQAWIADEAAARGVALSGAAAGALAERLGEDVGRLDGILTTLAATFGSRQLGPADIEPFLGEGGGVPPWELTDAIAAGTTAAALGLLQRMRGSGGRHPLQLMAILHGHYARLAKLDGVAATSEAQVADVLGIKPGFPARKALEQYRRLGGTGVQRAIDLLATADLDLRGAKDLPDEVVMDVLVARLSRLRR
ncbi:MAG: DNA polymerase III subunit delta [Ilumatobacteraceae bacterium]